MDSFLYISNAILWVFMIIQLAILVTFAKLVAKFLNRFHLSGRQAAMLSLQTGEKAPLFREKDQNNNMIKLSDYDGNKTLLIFKSDSCPVCKDLLDQLPALKEAAASTRIIVVAAEGDNVTHQDSANGIHFVRSNEVISNYFITKFPTVLVINEYGTILNIESVGHYEQVEQMLFGRTRHAS
ncbi:peroxiredoxin [Tumebacillus sp. BK434]|uniref:peroxiredoxin family protein n=1 Tax=Tumebacillus sp. BK434 TaxID=2512169 RepID=UPI00104DE0E0|nr:redoxin domain-containing protein [Tumebacillus sp. BK434]TCP57655.1 peroxiredoxin [Tumebacillus sp. BK434]